MMKACSSYRRMNSAAETEINVAGATLETNKFIIKRVIIAALVSVNTFDLLTAE